MASSFRCKLKRDKPGILGGVQLIEDNFTESFDLADGADLARQFARIVTDRSVRPEDFGQYILELYDRGTGKLVTTIRNPGAGIAEGAGQRGGSLSIETVADDTLLSELARRLRRRR